MRVWQIAALAWGVLMGAPNGVLAHEGHGHEPGIEIATTTVPRFEASSNDFELLAVLKGGELVLYLDRFRTNEPVRDASIEASANGQKVDVTRSNDGTYRIKGPFLAPPERIEFVFTVTDGELTDLLAGALEQPVAARLNTPGNDWSTVFEAYRLLIMSGVAGFLAGALTVLARRRARPVARATRDTPPLEGGEAKQAVAPAAGSIGTLCLMACVAGLYAQAGDARAQSSQPPSQLSIRADMPQRLPDGTLFVPKETQRLLDIRTVIAGESNVPRSLQLTGQVVVDPNGFGRVQTKVEGLIDTKPDGLPLIGQRVEKGQLLAYLKPIVPTADRTSYESTLGEIDTRIALATQKLARLSRIPGSVPQKEIEDTNAELDSLVRRRTAVRSALRMRHELTAPISGVISMSAAVPGQIANAREVLFEIVDPTRLWVEAIAYDVSALGEIVTARALTNTGELFQLRFVGRGLALRQQGTAYHFSIERPNDNLRIGQPVTVVIQTRSQRDGMILPQVAVVKGANGLPIAWTHIGAERFKPNIVKVQPLDGERVLIEAGIGPQERVVTEGATILSQIR